MSLVNLEKRIKKEGTNGNVFNLMDELIARTRVYLFYALQANPSKEEARSGPLLSLIRDRVKEYAGRWWKKKNPTSPGESILAMLRE